jgi:hypothetical protein
MCPQKKNRMLWFCLEHRRKRSSHILCQTRERSCRICVLFRKLWNHHLTSVFGAKPPNHKTARWLPFPAPSDPSPKILSPPRNPPLSSPHRATVSVSAHEHRVARVRVGEGSPSSRPSCVDRPASPRSAVSRTRGTAFAACLRRDFACGDMVFPLAGSLQPACAGRG